MVLPETEPDEALLVAERIRGSVETHSIQVGTKVLSATVSIGVCALVAGIDSATQLYERADQRLYEAKRAGRNRVADGRVEASAL